MLNVVAIMGRLVADPELRTTQQGTKRTAVEVLANNISFAGAKTADKPAVASYEQQTRNLMCSRQKPRRTPHSRPTRRAAWTISP